MKYADHRRRIEKLEALAESKRSGWQPIEGAPRDGRCLFITRSGIMRVDGFHAEQAVGSALRWKEAPIDPYTHWMPLPPPPTQP